MSAQELVTILVTVNVLLVSPLYVIIWRLFDRVEKLTDNLQSLSIKMGIVRDRMESGRIT